MADQEKDQRASTARAPELKAALDRLPSAPDASLLHAAIVDMLRELGIPDDLVAADVVTFRLELTNETDRGSALFAAAHLDERLAAMLRAFLVADDAAARPLFTGTGALATFSARIDMAYLVGLVPASVRRELHLIRKIRNDFAHSAKALQFADATIASRCRELRIGPLDADRPRTRFIHAAMALAGFVDGKVRLLAEGRQPRCATASEIPPHDPEVVKNALVLFAESIERVAPASAERNKEPREE